MQQTGGVQPVQAHELRSLHSLLSTPPKGAGGGGSYDATSAFSMPASALESAGKQDEVIRLKAALNEKEMELIELREQHMQLVARSQEARANWETALDAKDRAIDQLEDALASRQRALDAASHTAAAGGDEVVQRLAAAHARTKMLEANLAEAHATVMTQSRTIAEQGRQLDLARQATGQEASASDARARSLQQELATSQHQAAQLQREAQHQAALAAEKDGRLADAAAAQERLRQQLERVKEQLAAQDELLRQQEPPRLQQQLAELSQQLAVVQARASAKEASSRKYKDAVRAFKVKLRERDDALAARQAQVLELHTELSQLQRLLKAGGGGAGAAAAAAAAAMLHASGGSPVRSPGARPHLSRGSAEEAVAAATGELERLRGEVHGFHVELAALQAQLGEKERLLQTALGDAAALEAEREAAAARAEEATSAALHLERQLREARAECEAAQAARATASDALAAADVRLSGLKADQARGIRAEGELRVQLEQAQEAAAAQQAAAADAQQRLAEAQQGQADAARRVQQLEGRVEGLEAKLDAAAAEASASQHRADRQQAEAVSASSEAATLREQLAAAQQDVRGAAAVACDEQVRSRELQLGCSQQMRELEARVHEAVRQAQAADSERQQLEAAVAAAQAKTAALEARAAEAESQVLLLGRSLREAEAAALDWQARASAAEDAHQDLSQLVGDSEAAVKQVQADLAAMQLAASSERGTAAAHAQEVEQQLAEARGARADAEARARDAERQLADLRCALDSQGQLLLVLREQVDAGGAAAARVGELEGQAASLEAALSEARASEGRASATVSRLLAELADKSSQVVDAEHRVSQLEAVLHRIACRTGQQQQPDAAGLSGGVSQLAAAALGLGGGEDHQHLLQAQLASLRRSWAAGVGAGRV